MKNQIETLVNNSQYYEAVEVLKNHLKLEFECKFLENNFYFAGEKKKRDIYKITLKRGNRKYTFNFGQSTNNSQYYKDIITGRTYTLDGGCRTGNYSITDITKYIAGGNGLQLIAGEKPKLYAILACLQKYEVGTFEEFCSEFGYDVDSITAKKTYKAVVKEYDKVCSLFNDYELELLQLIN